MIRRSCVAVLTSALTFIGSAAYAQSAAPSAASARVEAANAAFAAAARIAGQDPSRVAEFAAAARERLDALAAVIEDAPGLVLASALSTEARAGLPPGVRDLVEEHVDLQGKVDVLYEIHRGTVFLRHTLDTARGRVSLHFAGEPPAWTAGQQVRIRGVRVNDAVALNAASTSTSGVAAAPLVGGDQKTLMMLVNFADKVVEPYAVDYARTVLFTNTNGFMRENSSQALSLSGDVAGWFTIALSSTVCDYNTLASQAQSAATAAGINLNNYSRYVYGFPDNACGWWGLGSVGGNPSRAWVNGQLELRVLGHEMGHNLGLYHSHSMDCGADVLGSTCATSEYGDTEDIMGGVAGHFNTFQKERLGWLSSSQIVPVTGGGTFTLEPYAALTGGVKALKILKSTDTAGKRTYYYVEFRQAINYDTVLGSGQVNGVSIRLGTEANPGSSYLLDLTPETASWYDPTLTPGHSYTDAGAGVTITVNSASATGAMVSVVIGPAACSPVAPSVTLTTSSSSVLAGAQVSYSAQITNNDTSQCAASTFAVAATVPSGWTVLTSVPSVTLAPGASTTVTMQVTSLASTAPGSYLVTARAVDQVDATHANLANAFYSVKAPVAASVSTDRAVYARGDTVFGTARVTSGGSPAAGVGVTFRYQKADGRVVSSSATTDASGVAVSKLSLRKRDPLGPYQVTATVVDASPAAAAFTVQ